MEKPTIIDTGMHGHRGITGCFLLRGDRTALVETGPRSTVANVLSGIQESGVESLDWIVVTHIHLDHAGAAGTLASRFPDAMVAVHEVGAPHLSDPGKLWSSAARIYGDKMEELWGGIDPIPPGRIHVLFDGDKIDLGGRSLQAIETPGHAYHHHAYLDDASGMLFAGDALGVRLPEVRFVRPATPPPEFHLEKAISSIQRIAELEPAVLCPTHFGPIEGQSVGDTCEEAIAALGSWAEWVRAAREQSRDLDEVARRVEDRAKALQDARLAPGDVARLESTTSYWMNTWGYMRYFDKKEERGS
jgi:glyoxylase-like metal-dependent hydrolase (beta-lactamase superfamily II)